MTTTGGLSAVSASVKSAPGDERNLHRPEVVAADDLLPAVRRGIAWRRRVADDRVRAGADVAVERHVRRQAGGRDARNRREPSRRAAARTRAAPARPDSARRQRDLRGQHVVAGEAGIDVLQPREALDQQTGADQQHHGEGGLGDDEQRAGHAGALSRRSAGAVVLQQRRDVAAVTGDGRHQAEDEAGHDRERHREARGPPDRATRRRTPGICWELSAIRAAHAGEAERQTADARRAPTAPGLRSASASPAATCRRRASCGSRARGCGRSRASAAGWRRWRTRSAARRSTPACRTSSGVRTSPTS